MRRAFVVALACSVLSCRPAKDIEPADPIRQYIRLPVALGEHDTNSLDNYYGPPEWVTDIREHTPKLDEIKRASMDLISKLQAASPAPPRQDYLVAQLRAMATRVDLLRGVRPSFQEEARALFALDMLPGLQQERLENIRKQIALLLSGRGTLAERYAKFEENFLIPDDKVPAVIQRALLGCRERTQAHLHLPAGEEVKVEYVSNRPWNAFSRYQGHYRSLIQINADFPITIDRALQLACHEGYPGHHAYTSIQDSQLVQHDGRLELMVQPTFSPQSFVSEALATYAVDVAFSPEERLAFERDVLFPLAGLDKSGVERYLQLSRLVDELGAEQPGIARDYIDGTLEWSRAASALEDRALMAHTEATLKYLNEFRTYMLTYTVGKDMVQKCMGNATGEDRWRLYEQLITWRMRLRDCGQ